MLKTIIALSFVLACGFLLIILSCALFNNWLPLLVILSFLLAPLPNLLAPRISSASSDDFDVESSAALDFSHFLTAFLVVTGIAMPVTLAHVGEITVGAGVMSVSGGVLVYGSIIVYGRFFSGNGDEF